MPAAPPLAAQPFHDEAIRSLDVFEVDGAEGRFQRADDIGELFGVGFVKFDIKAVDAREFLEQDGLALHHRLGGQRADVAQAQNGCAVGDDCHQIAARGIITCAVGVLVYGSGGVGDAGAVGEGQIAPVGQRLCRANFEFAGLGKLMIVERGLPLGRLGVVVVLVAHHSLPAAHPRSFNIKQS